MMLRRKTTLFFIHGMFVTPICWELLAHAMGDIGYRIVRPTLRYHQMEPGQKPDPRLGTVSILDYARDLEEQILQMSRKPVIIGHSMGGRLAQILAQRGLARAAVFIAPAPQRGVFPVSASAMKAFGSAMKVPFFWRKPIRLSYAEASEAVLSRIPKHERHYYYRFMTYESGRVLFEIALWPLDRKKPTLVDEKKITCPTLLLGAGKDRLIPPWVVRQIATRYKDAEFHMFPDMTHYLIGEPGWEKVARYLFHWLRKNI
ncbi:MAG: alpha/beta hydrolase [Chitinivibrionales bacterium]